MIHRHQFDRGHLPFRAQLEVAGTTWLFATNDECMIKTIQRWSKKNDNRRHASLEVIVDDRLNPSGRAPVYRGREHLVFATFGADFFAFDLRRNRISAVVCRQTASDRKFWDRILLPIAMGVMGCCVGVAPVHSACLDRNGVGILIAGASGAGKSTLSAALAKCGFAYISDDWTYLSADGADLIAHGLEVPLKLLPNSTGFFSGLRKYQPAPALNGELAYEVSADEFAAQIRLSARPKHLFLLERTSNLPSECVNVHINNAPRAAVELPARDISPEGTDANSPALQRREDSNQPTSAVGTTEVFTYTVDPIPPTQVRNFFETSGERLPERLNHARIFRSQIIDRIAGLHCWRFRYSGSPHDAAKSIRRFLGN